MSQTTEWVHCSELSQAEAGTNYTSEFLYIASLPYNSLSELRLKIITFSSRYLIVLHFLFLPPLLLIPLQFPSFTVLTLQSTYPSHITHWSPFAILIYNEFRGLASVSFIQWHKTSRLPH
jgi:hypothetical protein